MVRARVSASGGACGVHHPHLFLSTFFLTRLGRAVQGSVVRMGPCGGGGGAARDVDTRGVDRVAKVAVLSHQVELYQPVLSHQVELYQEI